MRTGWIPDPRGPSGRYLIRQLVEVAVARPLLPAAGPVPEGPSHLRQLLLAVAQVADVDDGHLVEGQHGPLLDAAQDDGVQLGVVVQQGAVHLQAQQVGGEVDVLDAGGELAGLRRQHLGGLPRPQHLPPAEHASSVTGHCRLGTNRICTVTRVPQHSALALNQSRSHRVLRPLIHSAGTLSICLFSLYDEFTALTWEKKKILTKTQMIKNVYQKNVL